MVVSVLVLWNTPTSGQDVRQQQQNKVGHMIKVILISFGLCALVLYIMGGDDQNAMMTNIIQGEPDF